MLSIFLCILACGSKIDSASEESNTQSTDTSSQQTSEPTSEVETEPVPRRSQNHHQKQNLHLSPLDLFHVWRRGSWSTSTSCEEWWISFETGTYDQNGNPMDTVGQTQSCFEYHLEQVATMPEQSDIELYCFESEEQMHKETHLVVNLPVKTLQLFCDAF